MIEEGLYSYLSSGGTLAADRIFPAPLPQGAILPAITYLTVSSPSKLTHGGPSKLNHPMFQIDCWADGDNKAHDADQLAQQVITLLDGYKGPMGTYTCLAGIQQNTRDMPDAEVLRARRIVEVEIWYQES